jgi:hypothetical protein
MWPKVRTTTQMRESMSRSDPVSHFGSPCRVSEIGWDELDFLPTLDANHQALLDSFYKNVKLTFGMAAMLESIDENFHKKIDAKVKCIHEWNSPKPTDQSTTEFCAAGRESQERDGTQPILHAIMLKLAHVLGLERHITQKRHFKGRESSSMSRRLFCHPSGRARFGCYP